MRKTILALTFAAAVMITPGLTPAAQARSFGWFASGAGFRIGGIDLSFVLGQPFAGRGPGYYYRTSAPLAYAGYQCGDRCFVDHGVYFHDRSCPVVHRHLLLNRIDPYDTYVRYAPRYDRYFDDGYYERQAGYGSYGYGGYDRNDRRYDRYDRYDRDDRVYRYDGDRRRDSDRDVYRERRYDRDRSSERHDRDDRRSHSRHDHDRDRDRDHDNSRDRYDHH